MLQWRMTEYDPRVKNWPKRIKGRGLKSVVELDDAATNTLVQGKPGSFPTAVLAWNIWLDTARIPPISPS
ncbi:MAG: hypothetical protein DSY87_01210 [Methylococcus sp.]|nr:MAG: hypothetical protein DSY87_01210 [Methylococcus sp.]